MRFWTESREAELSWAEARPSPLNLEAFEAKVDDDDEDDVQLSRVLEEICKVRLAQLAAMVFSLLRAWWDLSKKGVVYGLGLMRYGLDRVWAFCGLYVSTWRQIWRNIWASTGLDGAKHQPRQQKWIFILLA